MKSVYSLVLTDEVVHEIDRIAFESGSSRSNVVNEILAEHVRYTTPEKRMREVFSSLERILGGAAFEPLLQPSDAMVSLKSALSYKYNPSVRYSVELYRHMRPVVGELRVSVRSQNSALTLAMMQFFKLWMRVEKSYVGGVDAATEDGRYVRKLRVPESCGDDNAKLGEVIAAYIELFDRALKSFFTNLNEPALAVMNVERVYAAYICAGGAIL